MGLRHLLLPVLEFFEVQLRAKIAYHLAITYGSLGYMEEENFRALTLPNGSLIHRNLMGKFKSEVRRQRSLPFVRHHNAKYGGKFPIWAAVELFTFGMLASLYEIMREADQRAVSRDYGIKPEALSRLISASVNVRNICAHYNRLYNQPLAEQPDLPPNLRAYESDRALSAAACPAQRMRPGTRIWPAGERNRPAGRRIFRRRISPCAGSRRNGSGF